MLTFLQNKYLQGLSKELDVDRTQSIENAVRSDSLGVLKNNLLVVWKFSSKGHVHLLRQSIFFISTKSGIRGNKEKLPKSNNLSIRYLKIWANDIRNKEGLQ